MAPCTLLSNNSYLSLRTKTKRNMQALSDDFTISKIQPELTFKSGSVLHLSAADPHYGTFAITADKFYFFFDPDIDPNQAPCVCDIADIQEIKNSILKTFYLVEKDGTKTKLGSWKKKEIIAALEARMK